jgi:hypothetical protein
VSLESPRPALWKQPRSSPESHPVTGLRWLDYLRRQTAGEKSAFAIFMDYVIYVFLGLLLLLFLVFPLFSRSVRKLLRLKRLRDFIKRTIIQCRDWIVLAVAVIKDFFRRRSAGRTDGEKGTVKRADDWRKSTGEMPVLRWAREEHRIVRQFRRLQRWAAGKRIHYRRGQTATEYVEEIAGRYPVQRERLIFILETFEQALFSNHFLTREEMRRYFENIRAVTRKR